MIRKGIDYVLSAQKVRGMIVGKNPGNGPMYSHGISTLMLSEVSGMVDAKRQKKLDATLPEG